MTVHNPPAFVWIAARGPPREVGTEEVLTSSVWQGETMPAAGVWWGSARGSPRASLMQEPGSEVIGRGPAVEQWWRRRWSSVSGEGVAGGGRGKGWGGRGGRGAPHRGFESVGRWLKEGLRRWPTSSLDVHNPWMMATSCRWCRGWRTCPRMDSVINPRWWWRLVGTQAGGEKFLVETFSIDQKVIGLHSRPWWALTIGVLVRGIGCFT